MPFVMVMPARGGGEMVYFVYWMPRTSVLASTICKTVFHDQLIVPTIQNMPLDPYELLHADLIISADILFRAHSLQNSNTLSSQKKRISN